jgi:hypothetical protein
MVEWGATMGAWGLWPPVKKLKNALMFCLLYSPKQKIVKFHAQKQIGKSHVIYRLSSLVKICKISHSGMCGIFQYLTLYYIIKYFITAQF